MRQHKGHVPHALIAIVLGGCSATGPATESETSSSSSALSQVPRQLPHVMPTTVARAAAAQGQSAGLAVAAGCNANAHLSLQGGAALQAPTISLIEIDWGNNLSPETGPLAQALYLTLDETLVRGPSDPPYVPYSSWMRAEYASSVLKSGSPLQIAPLNNQASITDADIQAELARQVGLSNITADNNHIYMVHVPSTVSVSVSGFTSCVDWCAYHSFTSVNGHNLYYAVVPDFKNTACSAVCFENSSFGWQRQQQEAESHEIAETLTDGDFTGWQDPNQPAFSCGTEIGDICNGQSANIVGWNNATVTVQKEWSNLVGDCVTGDQTPNIDSIVPASGPRAGGQTVTITGSRFTPGNTTAFWFGNAQAAAVNCASATTCVVTTPPANPATGPSLTAGVKAVVNGIASSWDGTQDDYKYACGPIPAANACVGQECGSASDGCGGSVTCGGCAAGNMCAWGSCVRIRKCAAGLVNCDGTCVKPNFCM